MKRGAVTVAGAAVQREQPADDDGLFKVSQTKVGAWRTCRQHWYYRFVMFLRPKIVKRPLKFGSVVHEMLHVETLGQNPFEHLEKIGEAQAPLLRQEREHYGDIIADIGYIMRAYYAYYTKQPLQRLRRKGHTGAEQLIDLQIGDIRVKGKVDDFISWEKKPSLLEHKTHADFPNHDHRWKNTQSGVYIKMAQLLGWYPGIQGTLWNYIRSKKPTRPHINKTGDISARDIFTLPEVVVDVLNANGFKKIEQHKVFQDAVRGLPLWFERTYTPIHQNVVNSIWRDFLGSAREMMDMGHRSAHNQIRTVGKHCNWCQFEPLCRAVWRNLDTEHILKHEYVVDTTDYQDELTPFSGEEPNNV